MKKTISILLLLALCLCFAACDFIAGVKNPPAAQDGPFTTFQNQVTKDAFQKQYAQAFNSLQPDYTEDFVYIYTHDSTEAYETGADTQTANNRIEFDANNNILLCHYEFRSNDPDSADESYFREYLEDNGTVQFYDSRTGETDTRALGFDEFWEFAHSQITLILFPNPNKLYNDTIYYIDLDENGNTVFTLYSGDESDYSLRQMVFCGAEMLYRVKSYSKDEDCEDTAIDIYRVYNEAVTLTTRS